MHKINITGTRNLTKLCLSKYYFLYENNIRLFQNSGLIPLNYGRPIRILFAEI